MPLGFRMMAYANREKKAGREPFMDPLNPLKVVKLSSLSLSLSFFLPISGQGRQKMTPEFR
jgi:hypothetical protein